MSKPVAISIAFISLCLSGCTVTDTGAHFTGMGSGSPPPPGSYCYENPAICVIGGLAGAGILTGIAINSNQNSSNATAGAPPPAGHPPPH